MADFKEELAKAIEQLKQDGLSSFNLSPQRGQDESFEDYKTRQKVNELIVNAYKKGVVKWNPHDTIQIPETDNEGNIKKDKDGNIIYSGKTAKLSTYEKRFGAL